MNFTLNGDNNINAESFIYDILNKRGINNPFDFLHPQASFLEDSFNLDNMSKGIFLLSKHIENKSKIFILPDSDQDGYTAAAILWKYIKKLDPDANLYYKVHSKKQHGVLLSYIEPDTKLVIIPDAGSNQIEEHKKLMEKGIDVLVIDHHEVDLYNGDNACIINNQISDNYSNKALSGAGMAYKFCKAYDECSGYNYADDMIDLAAIGIIGDVMWLNNLENRYIVSEGLKHIKSLGIKSLIKKQEYSIGDMNKISPTQISFYITPLVNAIIRVGTEAEKQTLFEILIAEEDEYVLSNKRGHKPGDKEPLSEQFSRLATNAKSRQNRAKDKAIEVIQKQIEKEELYKDPILLVQIKDKTIDTTLTGLIAINLVNIYNRPVLVVREDEDGFLSGSGRNSDLGPIKDLRKFLLDSGLFEFVSGHPNAHGLSIHKDKLPEFFKYINDKLSNVDLSSKEYFVDYYFDMEQFYPQAVKAIMDIGKYSTIWGKGVEEPLIVFDNIKISADNISIIGSKKDTIKINYKEISFIAFKATELINKLEGREFLTLTIVGNCNINEWGGFNAPQVFIKDLEFYDSTFDF